MVSFSRAIRPKKAERAATPRRNFGARLPRSAQGTEQKLAWFGWAFLLFLLFDVKGFIGRSFSRITSVSFPMPAWPTEGWWPVGISHMTNLPLHHAERSLPGGNPDCRDRTGYAPGKEPDRQVHDFLNDLWRKANIPRVDDSEPVGYEEWTNEMDHIPFGRNMLPAEEMSEEDQALTREEWLDKYGHPVEIFQYHLRRGTLLEAVQKVFPSPEKGTVQELYKAALLRAGETGSSEEELLMMMSAAHRYQNI